MNARALEVMSGVMIILGAAAALAAGPSPTAFTYQGELKQGGELAQGVFDLELELYDLPTDGNLLGRVALSGVEVRDGVFTVAVDFGLPPPPCGVDRFLETHVRPAGGDEFTTLSPRQPLTAKADCTVDGTLSVTANLKLPPTDAPGGVPTAGVLFLGDSPFLHALGSENTFVGADSGGFSMEGGENTGVGKSSLASNTTGFSNTAIGRYALSNNTAASGNTAIGSYVLSAQSFDPGFPYNTYNVGVGTLALSSNQPTSTENGGGNTAVGAGAQRFNTIGRCNAALGFDALTYNTTGNENTAIGFKALTFLDGGDSNIALGSYAGIDLTSGSNNILIGNPGVASEGNTIRIGNSASVAAYIGGIYDTPTAGLQDVYVSASGQLGYLSSSRRHKHGIVDMGDESDVLMQLRPVAFYFRPELDPEQARQYGLVAEEVAEVAPALVVSSRTGDPEGVRYDQVNAMLLNEVQKQRREIDELRRMVQALMSGGVASTAKEMGED